MRHTATRLLEKSGVKCFLLGLKTKKNGTTKHLLVVIDNMCIK